MSDDANQGGRPPRPPFVAVLISIFPPPMDAADEFSVTAISATEGYSTNTPVVIGQYRLHDAQSLTVQVRIQPAPQPVVNMPPRFADGWPEEPAAFAAAIRAARHEIGLSQKRLAGLSGYTEMTIRNIETNRYAATADARRRLIEGLANAHQQNPFPTQNQRPAAGNRSTPESAQTQKEKAKP